MKLLDIEPKATVNKFKIITMLMLMSCLNSCVVYSGSFNCGDSKGVRCMMLSEVDKRVDSGEIETVYLDKKCRGKTCNKEINNVPKKALNQIHKVKIINPDNTLNKYEAELRAEAESMTYDGDDLYLK